MHRSTLSSRQALWVLWLCVLAVFAKSAMPFLANAAAERQGRALFEVCTVYGVSTVALDSGRHGQPDPASGHTAEHCALTALTAFAGGEPQAASVPAASLFAVATPTGVPAVPSVDPSARWAAQLRHGPPLTS